MVEGGELRVDPERRERLELRGGLDSLRVNVTLSNLHPSDTGLYMWELSYREENGSDQLILGSEMMFLLVKGLWFRHLSLTHTHTPLLGVNYGLVCLWCREVMPVFAQLPSTAPDHLYSDRASSAHTRPAGSGEMCESSTDVLLCRDAELISDICYVVKQYGAFK